MDLRTSDTSAITVVGADLRDQGEPTEDEVERKKETDDIKEGDDVKEKFRMVIKRLASDRRVETWSAVFWRQSKFNKNNGPKRLRKDQSGKRSQKSCAK